MKPTYCRTCHVPQPPGPADWLAAIGDDFRYLEHNTGIGHAWTAVAFDADRGGYVCVTGPTAAAVLEELARKVEEVRNGTA